MPKPSATATRRALAQVAAEAAFEQQKRDYDGIVFRMLAWFWFAGAES